MMREDNEVEAKKGRKESIEEEKREAKRELVFVWTGRRPAELGRSPASDSSCGLSFIS